MTYFLPDVREMSVGDVDDVSVSFTDELNDSETISSISSVAEVDTSDLTISAETINASSYTDAHENRSVAISEAATFRVDATGATAGTTYSIVVTVVTSDSRTLVRGLYLKTL